MASPNIFWKSAIDFRDFDISVSSFSFQNNIDRDIVLYGSGPYSIEDQITLTGVPGSAQNNSFLGAGITRSGQTITSGTLDIYVDNRSGGFDGYILIDGNPSASALNGIVDSVSTADDISYLRNVLLAGSDLIELSGGLGGAATNDYVFAAAGNDTVYGNRGNDTLFGDGGTDRLYGDEGTDQLFGGNGNDTIYGISGNDVVDGGRNADQLFGGGGADDLRGGKGNDYLSGDIGADEYIFRKGYGSDTIAGWQDGIDKIRIEAPGGTNVGAFVETQVGANCIISNGTLNIEITILNTNKNVISIAGDFLLIGI